MRTTKPVRTSAVLLACAVAGTLLLQTGVASAASRGYEIYNHSQHHLRLESATPLPTVVCGAGICVPTHWPMDFEGRPKDGTVLAPHARPQDWQLKYSFGYTYAAKLTYKIVGTDATFEATLETSTFSNNSACKIVPAHAGTCTAEGLKVTFR